MPLVYPGVKRHASDRIAAALRLPTNEPIHFVEAFAGSATVAHDLMRSTLRLGSRVTLIDADPSVRAVWLAVRDHADELSDAVARVRPSVALWRRCRALDGDERGGVVQVALRKLILHRLSYSGRGIMTGAPQHVIDNRWIVDLIRSRIRERHLAMRGFTVDVHDDAIPFLRRNRTAYVYGDPPYFGLGALLYRHAEPAVHRDLARALDGRERWVLHYGDASEIRACYGHHVIEADGDGQVMITPGRARKVSHREATRLGLARAVASGVRLGRPIG